VGGEGRDVNDRDVLLTGVPRGGTTLTCELLNLVEDTVALDEPMQPDTLLSDPDRIGDAVRAFCAETRSSLLERRQALTKHVAGRVVGAKVSTARGREARKRLVTRGLTTFDKPLSRRFTLVVKHPAMFTARLQPLSESFRLFAVIRHPLPVLASWQTVPFAVADGHLPVAERLDADLRARLAGIPEAAGRQLVLLDWLYGKYEQLPENRIVRYEDVITSGGAALASITPKARTLDVQLENKNRSYDVATMRGLGERLVASEGAYWRFYSRSSVAELRSR
jgi:hypothetical protein